MPISRRFGEIPPSDRVLVRVQHVVGGKVQSTLTYAVYSTFDTVLGCVETALREEFGTKDDDEGEETDLEETPVEVPDPVTRRAPSPTRKRVKIVKPKKTR